MKIRGKQGTIWIVQAEGDGYTQIILSNMNPDTLLDSTPLDDMPQARSYRSGAQTAAGVAKLTSALKALGFIVNI